MSYILDALRRADSERERGAVPSIHAKPVPEVLADDEASPLRSRPLRWLVGGLLLALAAVLAWQFVGRGESREAAATPASEPLPAVAATAPEPPESPSTVAPLMVALPAVPEPAPPAVRPRKEAVRRAPTNAVAAASAPVVESPVASINQLPEDIRRELPTLTVGGAMYSANVANRMLILNGQVFHEGDTVSPNLVLDQIKLKSAVLAYKGHRYSISY